MGLIKIFKPLSTFLYATPLINLCNSFNFSSENISRMWGIELGAAGSKCAMLPPKQYYSLGIFINFWSLDSGSQNTIFGATLSFRATFSLREKCNNFYLWSITTNSGNTKSSQKSQQFLSFMGLLPCLRMSRKKRIFAANKQPRKFFNNICLVMV